MNLIYECIQAQRGAAATGVVPGEAYVRYIATQKNQNMGKLKLTCGADSLWETLSNAPYRYLRGNLIMI